MNPDLIIIGDQALKKMIAVVCAEIRSANVIGRCAGDKFVILLPQTSAQEAPPFADRIHTGITAKQAGRNRTGIFAVDKTGAS